MWLLHKKDTVSMKEYQVKRRDMYDDNAEIEKTFYFVRELFNPLRTNRITGEKFVYADPDWRAHGKYVFQNNWSRFHVTEFKTVQEALDYIERLKSGAVYNSSIDTVVETVV